MGRYVGISVVVFAGTLAGLWAIFVRAPGPTEVCAHIVRVTVDQASAERLGPESEDSLLAGLQDRCVQHKRDKLQLRGRVKYARYAKCVMRATSLAEVESC